jgi:condensin complex subunit 3
VLNIRLDADSLAAILDRTRDIEPMTRKLVYMNVLLPNINVEDAEGKPIMGLTHPRALTIAQRELIVSNGLGDREDAVRAAAGHLVVAWVDALGSGKTKEGNALEDLLSFLSTFDHIPDTNDVAESALKSVFVTRPSFFDSLQFDGTWFARVYAEVY